LQTRAFSRLHKANFGVSCILEIGAQLSQVQ
jgi:hypothetical protein